ncbi:uncharacterized protein LOC130704261 isoform X2 [Daphnia carinata]|uniref:uncharacterized protein LOC130704261 isoform X2 n=1 Tax=Daphnia carinata TaxID=120202 RepID=UPI002580497E|nr:uncharacterized protein LOC130704261 isoform X2 [Daphnia carinata]
MAQVNPVKTPVTRFLRKHPIEHTELPAATWPPLKVNQEKKASGVAPIHPSKASRNRHKPCHDAGGKSGKTCLPVPVLTGDASRKPNKSNSPALVRTGKSRIPVLQTQHTMHGPKIEALKKKEKDLIIELIKTRAELERVESLQRKLLVLKPAPIGRPKRRSKSLALGDSIMDSPFTDSESPKIEKMSPAILSMTQSKNPGSLYETYRRTCKFLHTPRKSTFKQRSKPPTLHNDTDISSRIQRQLADLFV